MKERIATSALVIGAFYLSLFVVLRLFTGGLEIELFGVQILLYTLKKPVVITVSLFVVWLLLSKEQPPKLLEYIDNLSSQTHKKIAYTIGGIAALYLSLLKVWQHFTFQTNTGDLGIRVSKNGL